MTASLARAAAMEIECYDPALVIAAVNELQPLDKAAALHAIERCDEGPGLFWVLRVLFDVPDDVGFPEVELGTPAIPPPDDPAALPRFPIAIVQDIPVLVVGGYILRGLPEPVAEHVAYSASTARCAQRRCGRWWTGRGRRSSSCGRPRTATRTSSRRSRRSAGSFSASRAERERAACG